MNMLCAKYDYKMDIAVKQEEAFEDGQNARAFETAINLLKMKLLNHEQIAQAVNLPIETIKELAKKN